MANPIEKLRKQGLAKVGKYKVEPTKIQPKKQTSTLSQSDIIIPADELIKDDYGSDLLKSKKQEKKVKPVVSKKVHTTTENRYSKTPILLLDEYEEQKLSKDEIVKTELIKKTGVKKPSIFDTKRTPKLTSSKTSKTEIKYNPEFSNFINEVKLVDSEHDDKSEFIQADIKVDSTYMPKKKEVVKETKIPCSCPLNFADVYDCQKCNPLKQKEREEERSKIVQQIKDAYRRLIKLENIDGIKVERVLPAKKPEPEKDTRSFISKMMNFK